MPSPPTEESKALFKILVDVEDTTQWRSYEEVRDALSSTVAPGKAFRRYQDRLTKERKRRGSDDTETPLSDQAQIFYGARDVAQATISSWSSRGGLLNDGKKDGRRIKINPEHKGWAVFRMMVEQDVSKAQEGVQSAQESAEKAGGSPEVPPGDSGASEAPGSPSEDVFRGGEGAEGVAAPVEPTGGATVAVPEAELAAARPESWRDPIVPGVRWNEAVGDPAGSPWQESLLARAERAEAAAVRDSEWSPGIPEVSPSDLTWAPPAQEAGQRIPEWLQSVDLSNVVLCPVCKVLVIDSIDHDKWHADQDSLHADREMALINEKALRTLLGDVIRLELDEFRLSLAHYLDTEFSELRRSIASLRLQPRGTARWPSPRGNSTEGQ